MDAHEYDKQNGIEIFGDGNDLIIFATSWMVVEANVAKNKLAQQGLNVSVVSVTDLKSPL